MLSECWAFATHTVSSPPQVFGGKELFFVEFSSLQLEVSGISSLHSPLVSLAIPIARCNGRPSSQGYDANFLLPCPCQHRSSLLVSEDFFLVFFHVLCFVPCFIGDFLPVIDVVDLHVLCTTGRNGSPMHTNDEL